MLPKPLAKQPLLKRYTSFLFSILFLTGTLLGQTTLESTAGFQQEIIVEGIKVVFEMDHVDANKKPGAFHQGDDVTFRFSITDTLSKQGVSGAAPAAWMEPLGKEQETPTSCNQKISAFIGGSIFSRPELDLNVYYVLTLNDDATITVVDPLFGFGGTQLLALIELENPGLDWVVRKDQLKAYISIPQSKKVAVINTSDWKVEKYIPINAEPGIVEMQNNEEYLWVSFKSGKIENFSGVAVIETKNSNLKASIPTGEGEHQIVISDDNLYAFVSNRKDRTVSVIDIQSLKKIKDIPINGDPVSMSWSEKAKSVYIADKEFGKVIVIDGESHEVIEEVQGKIGMSQIKFEKTGRFAFIINTDQSLVQILDAASNRIVQTGDTELQPDQVFFSDELAYVRHQGSEIILMFPLDQIGREGEQLQAADFPAGDNPPGECSYPCPAPGLVQAPGANAILISNPLDKMIYYYMEGMAAPMGSFTNYKRMPRAVEVIDRSLEERNAGVYETVGKIRGSGLYDVAFFMDVPRITYCFQVEVKKNAALELAESKKRKGNLSIEHIIPSTVVQTGVPINYAIRLIDPKTKEPIKNLKDVRIRGTSPGNWFYEQTATELGGEGIYHCKIQFPDSGIYYIYVECLSEGLKFNNPQYMVLRAI